MCTFLPLLGVLLPFDTYRQAKLAGGTCKERFFFFFERSALQIYFPFPILFSSIEKLSLVVCYMIQCKDDFVKGSERVIASGGV